MTSLEDYRIRHMASKLGPQGKVSSLCRPTRAINIVSATWTLRSEAVTCQRCRALLRDKPQLDTTPE